MVWKAFSFLSLLSCLLDSHDSWAFVVFVMQGEEQTVDLIVLVGCCKVDNRQVLEADEALRLKTIDDARRRLHYYGVETLVNENGAHRPKLSSRKEKYVPVNGVHCS
jgi:hypothetical protein